MMREAFPPPRAFNLLKCKPGEDDSSGGFGGAQEVDDEEDEDGEGGSKVRAPRKRKAQGVIGSERGTVGTTERGGSGSRLSSPTGDSGGPQKIRPRHDQACQHHPGDEGGRRYGMAEVARLERPENLRMQGLPPEQGREGQGMQELQGLTPGLPFGTWGMAEPVFRMEAFSQGVGRGPVIPSGLQENAPAIGRIGATDVSEGAMARSPGTETVGGVSLGRVRFDGWEARGSTRVPGPAGRWSIEGGDDDGEAGQYPRYSGQDEEEDEGSPEPRRRLGSGLAVGMVEGEVEEGREGRLHVIDLVDDSPGGGLGPPIPAASPDLMRDIADISDHGEAVDVADVAAKAVDAAAALRLSRVREPSDGPFGSLLVVARRILRREQVMRERTQGGGPDELRRWEVWRERQFKELLKAVRSPLCRPSPDASYCCTGSTDFCEWVMMAPNELHYLHHIFTMCFRYIHLYEPFIHLSDPDP